MNMRNYFTMFKNEPDVLTVPDVIRLLRMGKNTVYKLLKEGAIGSIKQGKKIIVPKVCLVEFLTDAGNYQTPSPTVPNNLWTCEVVVIVLMLPEKPKDNSKRKERE